MINRSPHALAEINMARRRRRAVCFVGAAFTITVCGTALSAQARANDRSSYLQEASLGYTVPQAPANASSLGKRDLAAVQGSQHVDEARRHEAFQDAGAYDYDLLLPRFSEAAGTELSTDTRPILAHILKWLLADAEFYSGNAKYSDNPAKGTPTNKRPRPYREDASIVPCETDYLYPSDDASYPSGHAANGYVAALLIADVMIPPPSEPDRRPSILARGVRYGDNRVVCGVHHPSDVAAGRLLAQHVFDLVLADAEFQADFICAKRENESSAANRLHARITYSDDCQQRLARYAAEAAAQTALRHSQADPFNPQ